MFDEGENAYRSDLKLGERYRDNGTGLEGILVSIHFYEHACERGTLRYLNNQQDVIDASFDAPELVHVSSGKQAQTAKTGGPDRGSGTRSPPGRELVTTTGARSRSYLSTAQVFILDHACEIITRGLGHPPYLVGSSMERSDFRDVDLRSILPDDEYDALFGESEFFWSLFCYAVSEMLMKVTGLPIDYQVQRMTEANAKYGDKPRNPFGLRGRLFAGGGDAKPEKPKPKEGVFMHETKGWVAYVNGEEIAAGARDAVHDAYDRHYRP